MSWIIEVPLFAESGVFDAELSCDFLSFGYSSVHRNAGLVCRRWILLLGTDSGDERSFLHPRLDLLFLREQYLVEYIHPVISASSPLPSSSPRLPNNVPLMPC